MRYTLFLALLCPFLSNCQPLTLKGKIINENGNPVPNATITVKRPQPLNSSTPQQSSTPQPSTVIYQLSSAPNGEFTLTNLHFDDTLLISAIGYQTAIEIYDYTLQGRDLTIALKRKTSALAEVQVVNTGYQSIPKERATGAFTTINSRLFNQQVSTDVLSRLEGITNSLSFDRKTIGGSIMVRGLSSIKGPKSPLIILDNFPYDGDITNINPNDVENITVLKDAAAASIWGARAGNGVIVITTKKAKFNQPFRLDLNIAYAVINPPDLNYLPVVSSSDYIDLEKFLFSKGYRFSDTALNAKPPFSPVYEILFRQRRGLLTATEADAQIDALRSGDLRGQFSRYSYSKGLNRQYALSAQGGSTAISWLASMGYDKNTSPLSEGYDRLTARLQNTFYASPKILITANITSTGITAVSGKPAYNINTAKGALPPYISFVDASGSEVPVYKDYRQTYIDTAGGGRLLDWKFYPLQDYKEDKTRSKTLDILATLSISYKFIKHFSLDVKYQYENAASNSENLRTSNSYFTRNLVNTFTQINRATGALTYKVPKGDILDKSASVLQANNLRAGLTYANVWSNNELNFILGAEMKKATLTSNTYRTFGFDPNILTSGVVDFTTAYPSFVTGSSSNIPNNFSFGETVNRFVSFYGNGAYTFNKKYTVTASARRDASNLFGVSTNNRWTPLWSSGLAWNLSNESFYKFSEIPYLHLRITYGYSGNIDASMSALTTLSYFSGTSSYTQSPIAVINRFANPDLRWERSAQLNFGLDFKTIGNRLFGSIEYYHKKGTDLFGNAPLDYTAGLSSNVVTKNVASMKSYGWDFEINSVNIDKNILWTSRLNLSLYKDRVTNYYLASYNGSDFINGGQGINALVGYPVYGVFAYKWAGLDGQTGDPVGYLDGAESKDYTALTSVSVYDLAFKGPLLPKTFGSLQNTIGFKSFELSAVLSYKFGYWFRRGTVNYGNLFAASAFHSDYSLRWQKPGDEAFTNVPSLVYPAITRRDNFYTGAEVLVEKGDHIRLQYLTLSYTLTRATVKKLPFKSIQLYANASNLGILWRANKHNLDPDYVTNAIPPSPNYAFGLRTTL